MKLMSEEYIKEQVDWIYTLIKEGNFGKARQCLKSLIVSSTPLKFKGFEESFAQIAKQFPSGHKHMLLKHIADRKEEIKQEEKRKAEEKKAQEGTPSIKINFGPSSKQKDYGPGRCRYCGRPAMYASDVCYKHSRE